MCKIRIKNFGPITTGFGEDDGFMDIARVTVFIGDQGTGKSTVTKLVSTLTWLEKALVRGELREKDITSHNKFVTKHCAYQNIHNYFSEQTAIDYQGKAYAFHYAQQKIEVTKNQKNGYQLPKIMYIPAERNFLSVVDRPGLLKNLPSTLYTFLDEFEKAKQHIGKGVNLPVGNVTFEYQKLNKLASIAGKGYRIRLSEASSGYQSVVPLFIVARYLSLSLEADSDTSSERLSFAEQERIRREIRTILTNEKLSDEVKKASLEELSAKFRNSCFVNIVEEPEQNLYPISQQKILFNLLEFVNKQQGNKLIITTHSPYIISYLTFAVKGHSLIEKINKAANKDELMKQLEAVIPSASCLPADDALIYEIYEGGEIKKLQTYEGLPSDDNLLNTLLAQSNETFDRFFELEELCR